MWFLWQNYRYKQENECKKLEINKTSVLICSLCTLLMKCSTLKSSLHNIVSTDWAMKSNPGTGELISIRNILRPGDFKPIAICNCKKWRNKHSWRDADDLLGDSKLSTLQEIMLLQKSRLSWVRGWGPIRKLLVERERERELKWLHNAAGGKKTLIPCLCSCQSLFRI